MEIAPLLIPYLGSLSNNTNSTSHCRMMHPIEAKDWKIEVFRERFACMNYGKNEIRKY